MCSLISSTVNTFDDKPIAIENDTKPNCSVLLVADCSIASRFAVFVTPIKDNEEVDSFALEMHVDDQVVWYTPNKHGNDFIRLENSTEVEITTLVNPLGREVELR